MDDGAPRRSGPAEPGGGRRTPERGAGGRRVTVVAEAGVNHDGSLERARELVDAAAEAGADAVKFQTFRAGAVVRGDADKAGYQERATGGDETQREMLERLELTDDEQRELRDHCRRAGVEFLSTPFDRESLAFLVEMDVPAIKIGSGDLTNEPLLRAAAAAVRPLVLSTGMATLGEVERALATVASERLGVPDPAAALAAEGAWTALREDVTLLHCTSEYPAPVEEVNLRAMDTLRSAFGLEVGYSDHTLGLAVPVAAAARGAALVEKHFTLDRGLEGPDHAASTEPDDFRRMVDAIRAVEAALGSGRKVPSASELENRTTVRRGLVAAAPIAAGEPFTEENLDVRRPADGVPAHRYREYLGRTAARDYEADEPIRE